MAGLVKDQHLEKKQIEKQMGCMSGFFQIFDRQQMLSGKKMNTKRLPPPTAQGDISSPEPVKSVEPEPTKLVIVQASPDRFSPSPSTELNSPSNVTPPKSPLPLPIFELKEGAKSTWKFCKEAPRLSLDSRATVDAKGSLSAKEFRTNRCDSSRRSTSVIGRLMGLEPMPANSIPDDTKQLRRSASESRVSRDLFHTRFVDVNNFQNNNLTSNAATDNAGIGINKTTSNYRAVDLKEYSSKNVKSEPVRTSPSQWRSSQQRRSYFDSTDFFPEPKQTTVSIFGEIERRLKMRGIDEQSTDLETLKQILEALQLKGLLHSKKPSNHISHRNIIYDQKFSASDDSPIVVMKPRRSLSPNGRAGTDAGGIRRSLSLAGESTPSASPRRDRTSPVKSRNSASSTRNEITTTTKSSNSIVKRKPLSIQTQTPKRANKSPETRRVSPVQSPKLTTRKSVSDQSIITNRSPRSKKPTVQMSSKDKMRNNLVIEDESSSISESTVSTSSLTDTERSKMEEYREGRNLLDRCDKLLNSIAEMNGNELQPSPVSVLDSSSSFYKDESSSPSPIMKRRIDFKVDLEDEVWSPTISPGKDDISVDDPDFIYITEIMRAITYLPEDSDIFFLLEKQQYLKGNDTSRVSKLQRKLTFDVITQILHQMKKLPPRKAGIESGGITFRQIWSEFQRIRERETADDLLEVICSALRKDLEGITGWGGQQVEMSEAVLDIERLIFKDLVSETIRDLAYYAGESRILAPRRKLFF